MLIKSKTSTILIFKRLFLLNFFRSFLYTNDNNDNKFKLFITKINA